jgi:hypothetical protein
MALETATYISNLTATNPTGGDVVAQGDDHLRLIKGVLQATFPVASRPFRFSSTNSAVASNVAVSATTDDNKIIPVNARTGPFTVTLPITPDYDGYTLTVMKADFSINAVTIAGNSRLINGAANLLLQWPYQSVTLYWSAGDSGWYAVVSAREEVGTLKPTLQNAAPPGYVLAFNGTLGSTGSAGTLRANLDALALYQTLWNTFSDTLCPVSSGRGVSALADFDANKRITMLDLRGRTIFGKDNMGGAAAGRITTTISGVDGTVAGGSGGSEGGFMLQSALPGVQLSVTGTVNSSPSPSTWARDSGNQAVATGGASAANPISNQSLTINSTFTGGITSSINGGVAQTYTNNLSPATVFNYMVKL